jgi:ABC-2 type transport system permease protein
MSVLRSVLVRSSALLVKESVAALKQPRLLLSLIVGPFLLLLLFGLGFTGRREPFETVLVLPDAAAVPTDVESYRDYFLWSLDLVDVTTDESEAFRRLEDREVDAVVVAPDDPLAGLAADEAATFGVYYKHLNPVDRARINSVVYGHTRELNAMLVAAILDGLLEAGGVRESNDTALDELRDRLLRGDSEGALRVLDRLLAAITLLRITGEAVVGAAPEADGSESPLDRFELALRAVRAEINPERRCCRMSCAPRRASHRSDWRRRSTIT